MITRSTGILSNIAANVVRRSSYNLLASQLSITRHFATRTDSVTRTGGHFSSLTNPAADKSIAVPPAALFKAEIHPKTHNIPVGLVHFRSHHPDRLSFFLHFVMHAAHGFGIPVSHPVALPTQRSLHTVLKGPFVHKKAQENFESKTHKRAIKMWDADPTVVAQFLKYLETNMMAGIGMRVISWDRVEYGWGKQIEEEAKAATREIPPTTTSPEETERQVREMADKIVKQEMKAAGLEAKP